MICPLAGLKTSNRGCWGPVCLILSSTFFFLNKQMKESGLDNENHLRKEREGKDGHESTVQEGNFASNQRIITSVLLLFNYS